MPPTYPRIEKGISPQTSKADLRYAKQIHAAKNHLFRGGTPNQPVEVTVHVPDKHGITPRAEDWKDKFDRAPGAPVRGIINLILRAGTFDPPVQVRVKMLPNELADEESKLAYYDPTQDKWFRFPDADFFKEGDEFVVWIRHWFDDPAIGSWP
jgi:hypothetical protein